MSSYVVEILDDAAFELREIYEYIRLDNDTAASNIYKKIKQAISDLADFPNKGSFLDRNDRKMSGWKYIIVNPYLIFYRINGSVITVYHIIDGRRDYLEILKSNK